MTTVLKTQGANKVQVKGLGGTVTGSRWRAALAVLRGRPVMANVCLVDMRAYVDAPLVVHGCGTTSNWIYGNRVWDASV